MWALNISFDFTRLDTPFYLVHGWDTQSTVEVMMGDFPRDVQLRDAQEWRTKIQRQGLDPGPPRKGQTTPSRGPKPEMEIAHGPAQGRLRGRGLSLALPSPGSPRSWLIFGTNGPFRILEKGSDYRYRLQVEGTEYRFYPWVHVSRLKPRAKYPDRPSEAMNIPENDDFDAALLREDSWVGSPTRVPESSKWKQYLIRRIKHYQVKWKGYEVPDWVLQGHLNCGRLLYEFDLGERARARFQAMQSGDELPDEEVR
ncbi:hypothetical protein PHMEG_00025814, partial [Phytophthora megakarya]